MIVYDDDRVREFVEQKTGTTFYPPFTMMGLEKNGKIVCGAVFNCYTGYDIELTIAAERGAITRGFLRAMGRYVRDKNGCERVTLTTEQPKVIELATRLNAQTEGRIRNHFGPGRDAILLGILKDEWSFY